MTQESHCTWTGTKIILGTQKSEMVEYFSEDVCVLALALLLFDCGQVTLQLWASMPLCVQCGLESFRENHNGRTGHIQ